MITCQPLRYLIGDYNPEGKLGYITESPGDCDYRPMVGQTIMYANLFDDWGDDGHSSGEYGPYRHDSDTARDYHEGEIDPKGPGWLKNLDRRISKAKKLGFTVLELDNPDAYHAEVVIKAIDYVWQAGLSVVAKNPLNVEGDNTGYLAHPTVVGCIVEQDCGTTDGMDALRRRAGKPILPVWFVSFGRGGRSWIDDRADIVQAKRYVNMGCSWSKDGEYTDSIDILHPTVAP
jgi:hypothetical protein